MSLSNFNYVAPTSSAAATLQDSLADMFQTKLGYPQKMLVNDPTSAVNTFSCVQLQNHLLKSQVNELQKLVLQYEFTNQKALETLKENMMLREKAVELELKIGVLSETTSLQRIEIKRRDHSISSLRKDISEHNRRIEILSEKCEENGFEACNICCRNPPVVTICRNHCEGEQIVGCIFCALRKCPLCRNKNIERSFVQKQSKKIRKSSRRPARDTPQEEGEVLQKVKEGKTKRKEVRHDDDL